jgi:hypothetical protein
MHHSSRFELSHPCLWHVLHGEFLFRLEHPPVPPNIPSDPLPIVIENSPPPGPAGGPPSGSVPEPSSAVMLLSALILALLAAARRRTYLWLRPQRKARPSSA